MFPAYENNKYNHNDELHNKYAKTLCDFKDMIYELIIDFTTQGKFNFFLN